MEINNKRLKPLSYRYLFGKINKGKITEIKKKNKKIIFRKEKAKNTNIITKMD